MSTIVKAKASSPVVFQTRNQKVLLVKKVPTKSCDSDTRTIKLNSTRKYQTSDESDTDATPANGSEKIVKFATTAEVCEISNVDRCQKTEDQRRMAMIKTNCRKGKKKDIHHRYLTLQLVRTFSPASSHLPCILHLIIISVIVTGFKIIYLLLNFCPDYILFRRTFIFIKDYE